MIKNWWNGPSNIKPALWDFVFFSLEERNNLKSHFVAAGASRRRLLPTIWLCLLPFILIFGEFTESTKVSESTKVAESAQRRQRDTIILRRFYVILLCRNFGPTFKNITIIIIVMFTISKLFKRTKGILQSVEWLISISINRAKKESFSNQNRKRGGQQRGWNIN